MIKEMEMTARGKIKIVIKMNKIALAKFLIPFGITGFVVAFLGLFFPEDFGKYVMVFSVYSFLPLIGPLSVVPTGLGIGIPPVPLISFITFMDAMLALFLVLNFDYAKKVPGIGELVERVERSGEEAIRKYKWAMRFGFIGLVLFVMVPLQWTGAGIGSIVGRLIGMPPLMTWLAVIIGTFIRSTLVTLTVTYLGTVLFF